MSNYLNHAAVWVELVKEADRELHPGNFTRWLVAVGIEGTDEDRAYKGRELLPVFVGLDKRMADR